jgi:hypothetical protein
MRPLERARPQAQLGEAPEASVVGGAVLAPELEQDFDRLLGHLRRLVEIQAELGELAGAHPLADPEVEPAAREVVERGRLGGQAQRVMEGKDVDVVAKAHPRGPLERRGDHQVGARQQRVVREVVLGEPALAEPERLGQRDLVEHLGVGLVVRDAAALTVVEEPEVHRQDARRVTGSDRST